MRFSILRLCSVQVSNFGFCNRKFRKTRVLHLVFGLLLLAVSSAEAQQPKRLPRIGVLVGSSAASVGARLDAFRRGMRDLGHIEGKNIVVEYRYAEGKPDRIPLLATELARLNLD